MIRRLTVVAVLTAAASLPVLAQTPTKPHPQHPPGQPHTPHEPMDPALHAALHARLVGNWSGTIGATDSTRTPLRLTIGRDKQGQMTVSVSADAKTKAVPASEVALDAHGLHWSQAMTGKACKATGSLEAPAAHHGSDTMTGTMTCSGQDLAFTLKKSQG